MNGSAHNAPSVLEMTLKRGPAGKFGSLFDFSCTVGAVETVQPGGSVLLLLARPAPARNADITGVVNPNR